MQKCKDELLGLPGSCKSPASFLAIIIKLDLFVLVKHL